MSSAGRSPTHPGFLDCLDDRLVMRLPVAPAEVRRHVEYLVSRNPVARMLGLDGLQASVLQGEAVASTAAEALPFLFALARAPRFPQASAVLRRLAMIIDTVDDPPRSFPEEPAREGAPPRLVWEAYAGQLPALLHIARTSRDPESARAAAHIASHFSAADAQLEPIVMALLTGAPDEVAWARLLHALALVQGARGGPLHVRVERSLDAHGIRIDRAAVALALAGPGARELWTRAEGSLEELAAAGPQALHHLPDPSCWGDRDLATAVHKALVRLRRAQFGGG